MLEACSHESKSMTRDSTRIHESQLQKLRSSLTWDEGRLGNSIGNQPSRMSVKDRYIDKAFQCGHVDTAGFCSLGMATHVGEVIPDPTETYHRRTGLKETGPKTVGARRNLTCEGTRMFQGCSRVLEDHHFLGSWIPRLSAQSPPSTTLGCFCMAHPFIS